ncbi:MAG: RNA-binding transcriptional accessory protein [Clostridiales bacterium]|nr:RNA-binding transcriptional accessory protein [Clostridiales bacterium]
MEMSEILAGEFHLKEEHVRNVIQLIDDGNTIPFIARYRKEMTGSLDDQVLRELCDRLDYLRRMEEQREKVRASIDEQGQLTGELAAALAAAVTLTEIEDIYRPYRPKRRTRASAAKEKGLQPLADALYAQPKAGPPAEELAAPYVDGEKGVESAADALAGAADILAELAADDPNGRKRLRVVCLAGGELTAKAVDDDPGVYAPYADYREPLRKLPGHRILAVNRGEAEKKLKVAVEFDRAKALSILRSIHVKDGSVYADIVGEAVADAWDRLLFPSLERELRGELTDRASEDAIRVFSLNLRQLLMQPPVKGKVALGLDPGYRNGCKAAVVDPTGRVLDTGVIYPVPPFNRVEQAKKTVTGWILRHGVQVVAIGNGTASRETEIFAAGVIKELAASSPAAAVSYMVVSEAGASVYSASKLAAEEFPQYDVNLRSAVSIARRMQDPLAELVKIDPKAIGVGQYQHDMPQNRLASALDGVVESCVNTVGVDLNTASAPLLSRVAGVSGTVAKNIVGYREENGAFTSRSQLKKVRGLGPKAFEQCAGFLRVPESKELLDHTAVHPESYAAARGLLARCGLTPEQVRRGEAADLPQRAEEVGFPVLAEELGVGEPTLRDIVSELLRPGRDPRDELPPPLLRTDVLGIEDLNAGMELEGTVRNVVDFGAFVDIGVHQDGLVHISRITDRFLKHPSEAVKVGDVVKVWVLSVEKEKKRISLTMVPDKH